jgi:galactonate dehydratase
MKITKIETIIFTRSITIHAGPISWLWVRVHTDDGLVGLGETYPAAEAAEAALRTSLAPVLLGQDPREVERLWQEMFLAVSYHGWAGAELRAVSAVDIALWDLLGKATGQPVYQLLGGRTRERIRTYNTCYDHVYDFNEDAGRLAEDLLSSGIEAMKIWPFDQTALRNRGQYITPAEMEKCLAPVRQIRDAVGDRMELAMEFHGYWNLPTAARIARALEPYNILWLEEMLPQDNLQAYRRLKEETSIPLVLSERLMTRWQFREVIEQGIAQFVNPDVCWCGGITEAKKIATFAETHYLPVAPHNCGGPVLHFASLHLAANVTNLFILESVRRHYLKEYQGIVLDTGAAEGGWLRAPDAPGLGVELDPAVLSRPGVRVASVTAD